MILSVVLLFLFLGILGGTMRDGLWTNTVRLVNVIFAGILASSLGEVVGGMLRGAMESRAFYTNYLGTWIVFCLTLVVLREITGRISRVKVRFHKKVNQYGGYGAAALLGMVFVSFTLFTIHQAPLTKNCFRGGFQAEQRMMFGLGPDRSWSGFFAHTANGALGSGKKFDSETYRRNYQKGRAAFEKHVTDTGTTAINKGQFN